MPERLPGLKLFLLAGLAFYFLLSYRVALATLGVAQLPKGLPALQGVTWLGRWKMFTDLRDEHWDVEAEVQGASGWTRLDLAERYPLHWDEGPGYLRDDYYQNPKRLSVLAADLCRIPGTRAARFTEVRWPKTRGQEAQPRTGEKRTELVSFGCR